MYVRVCMYVCVWERERERECVSFVGVYIYFYIHVYIISETEVPQHYLPFYMQINVVFSILLFLIL